MLKVRIYGLRTDKYVRYALRTAMNLTRVKSDCYTKVGNHDFLGPVLVIFDILRTLSEKICHLKTPGSAGTRF